MNHIVLDGLLRRGWLAIPMALLPAAVAWCGQSAAPAADGSGQATRPATTVTPAASASASLGAHTLLGQEDGRGTSPAVTAPVDTQPAGSSFVVFNAGFVVNTLAPTDNKGNVWTQLGPAVVYNGYDGAFDIKAYTALAGHGGTGHVISIVKNGRPEGELTLPFIEIRDAPILQAVAQNYPAAGPQASSGTVTTTGPAVLLAFWWGDGYFLSQTAIPDNGFSIIENFVDLPPSSAVQCVVAYRQVSAAGTYHVTWQQSPEQGAVLWLLAFQAAEPDLIFADGFD